MRDRANGKHGYCFAVLKKTVCREPRSRAGLSELSDSARSQPASSSCTAAPIIGSPYPAVQLRGRPSHSGSRERPSYLGRTPSLVRHYTANLSGFVLGRTGTALSSTKTQRAGDSPRQRKKIESAASETKTRETPNVRRRQSKLQPSCMPVH